MSRSPAPRTISADAETALSPTTTTPAQDRPAAPAAPRSRPSAVDTGWMLGLFGTAIGAGILFLPINAGAGGLWPLLVVTVLIGPMTYLSHRALARFVCASPKQGEDITVVARDYFGEGAGRVITVLYFLAIYPIVLIYGVGITNTVDSLLVNQLGLPPVPRVLLSGVLIALMMLVMVAGQRLMLAVTRWLVYPLILALLGVTVYLVPTWQLGDLAVVPSAGELTLSVWLIIPVMVFAFNHSPAISQFSLAMQREHGVRAPEAASRVLRRTTVLLVLFTMAFVWSCVLSLGTTGLQEARDANLPVLSHLANVQDSPWIGYLGPAVAIVAIVSSFFGHYLGAAEGAAGIVRSMLPAQARQPQERTLRRGIAVFVFLTTWAAAVLNPSILSLIESLAGPVIAVILYLMPMYAVRRIPALAPYRGQLSNVFVTVAGLVAISGILFALVR
ncbi:HAAAP family serine/threonine permease [Kocuria sp. CH-021]|uniref:HAAAP family serine/threonine permease n=1 Tax=Kocuria sp. CH-021 TaxID=3406735 RepID=UPI003C781367